MLQANAQLVQKGECWTWNQRLIRDPGSFPTRVIFCYWTFMFSRSNANIGIIADFMSFENPLLDFHLLRQLNPAEALMCLVWGNVPCLVSQL